MGLISIYFLIFLLVLFPTYFLCKKKYRWIVLLVASLTFYVLCSWKSIFFIMFSSTIIYFMARNIDKNKEKEKNYLEENKEISFEDKKIFKKKNKKTRKKYLTIGIISVLLVLIVMKYLNFIIDNTNSILSIFNSNFSFKNVRWLLPLGISFYTFQAIGYICDVYWGKHEAEKNFFKFLLFMSFFAKIMQGPIIRYNDIKDSLYEGNDFEYNRFVDGLKRTLWGYFKKMVIADCLVVFTKYAFSNVFEISGSEALLTILCYFIYDYCDFSGYMDIVCGISYSIGVKTPENFNHPYFAKGIDDYWRRWHMTLGAWFKDYVFYPLSISKFSLNLGKKSKKIFKKFASKIPAIFGLILVWFTTGLWHGASWNYVLWGLYFGLIIILSIIFEAPFNKLYEKLKINKNAWWLNLIRHIRTLILLAFGKILFETNSISSTFNFIGRIFDFDKYFNMTRLDAVIGWPSLVVALVFSVVVLVIDIIQEKKPETSFIEKTKKIPLAFQWTMWILLIVCIIWFGYYGEGLPKFEFGYMRF